MFNNSKVTVMKSKKTKAMIIAMAAIVGSTAESMNDCAAAALRDIKNTIGASETYSISDPFELSYDWLDSSDGDSYA